MFLALPLDKITKQLLSLSKEKQRSIKNKLNDFCLICASK